jgi:hypothetical protein
MIIKYLNVKTLLSHRYGYRSLPERVLATEFDILADQLKSDQFDMDYTFKYEGDDPHANLNLDNLLDFCYKLNENELPPRRNLIPLEDVFENYTPKVF